MEKREKKARIDSLAELRRLRTEGGSRIESLKKVDDISNYHEGSSLVEDVLFDNNRVDEEYSEDERFIEHEGKGEGGKRPGIFSFKPRTGTMPLERRIEPESMEKDEYLQSLLCQMDEEYEKIDDDDRGGEHDEHDDGDDNPAKKGQLVKSVEEKVVSLKKESVNNTSRLVSHSLNGPETDTFIPFEFAPAEGQFEIAESVLQQQLAGIKWFDDDIDECTTVTTNTTNTINTTNTTATTTTASLMDCYRGETKVGANEIQPLTRVKENYQDTATTTLPIEEVSERSTIQIDNSQKVNSVEPIELLPGQPVNFYWLDAYEKPNGTILLFGRVTTTGMPGGGGDHHHHHVSCCLTINNMKRNVFFLPRETLLDNPEQEVTLKDLYEEISSLAGKYRISRFGCKKVLRKYAFEIPDIPIEADYIKMVYGFGEGPALPKDLSGRSFSHVFGTNTNALELFLIKRKIMGPCWLHFVPKSVTRRKVSWCRMEMEVDEPKSISIIANGPEPPTLTVLSLSLRTILNKESKTHEIVAASGLVYNSISVDGSVCATERHKCSAAFSVVREIENQGFTQKFTEQVGKAYGASGKIELAKNERALLGYLIVMIYRADPDVLVGHNFLGFDLGILLHRMRACKVDLWSRLGRLNWSQWPKSRPGSTESSFAERQIVTGRLVCDTYLCAKDLVKSRNYTLQTLVETQLGQERVEFDYERVGDYFVNADKLVQLLRHCEKDAFFQAMLLFHLQVLPLTKQLTSIAGNLWSRTLVGGRAERNEYLLLHEFHNQKYLCPDRNNAGGGESLRLFADDNPEEAEKTSSVGMTAKGNNNGGGSKRKPTFAGGLVLEPKKGLYDNIVLLLDFNSLYPSIIQEFNICFTTIERDYSSLEAAERMPLPPELESPPGLLPKILASLVQRRRQIKSMMKDSKLTTGALAQLNIRQQALKLTANSMYGCLGFAHSRFFAKPLAMLITAKGREILQSTVDLAQTQCRLDVIYGDTDSVMINTGTRDLMEAKRMGQMLKKSVNERYRLLEIELDSIFERLLLLKKKKYAAIILEEKADGTLHRKIETKGLDLVRRDWCELSVETSNSVLNRLLSSNVGGDGDDDIVDGIHQILGQVAANVTADKIPLEKYIISKNLTKEPEHYNDAQSQPHVQVALKMRERGMAVKAGDTIPYIICCGAARKGTTNTNGSSLAECAFHPDDVRKEHLQDWYLSQQVHPCVVRLCEHLAGTDSGRLAACLGLESSKYNVRKALGGGGGDPGEDDNHPRLSAFLSDEEKFRNVEPFLLTCPSCQNIFQFKGIIRNDGSEGGNDDGRLPPALGLECKCGQRISCPSLAYQLLKAIRHHVNEYYLGWMECDEATCNATTRQLRVYENRCPVEACKGSMRPRYPGQKLYYQLLYYRSLIIDSDHRVKPKLSPGIYHSVLRSINIEIEPVRALLLAQLDKCAFPIISLGEIFAFVKIA